MRFETRFSAASGLSLLLLTLVLASTACQPPQNSGSGTAPAVNSTTNSTTTAGANTAATPAATPLQGSSDEQAAANLPVTMPVLDAMFSDEKFPGELKSKINLTDEQIERLRQTAREATANLSEPESDNSAGSTSAATRRANEEIRSIIGDEKAAQLTRLVRERWQGDAEAGGSTASAANPNNSNQKVNVIPGDTRIVVNAPAYRMDLFKDGQLMRSYKVGIGYPEFPLPTGTRRANEIIFNPTWTPPDEPWVKGKIKPGQKVEAGSSLNPLGPIKIPIGSPSLIHGGKSAARLGGFASHGCVGLTNPQVQDFALALAQITGTQVTDQDIVNYQKAKTETKNVRLSNAMPVELRYETIVVEDGKLKIYRDVYERGTNTEQNLRSVLEAYGVSFDSLSEDERAKALEGLQQMARDAGGDAVDPNAANTTGNANTGGANNKAANNKNANKDTSVKETRTIKGQKEVTIEIAALKGKGYPAPVDLNTGGKSRKPLGSTVAQNTGGNNNRTLSNSNSNQTTGATTNTSTTGNTSTRR